MKKTFSLVSIFINWSSLSLPTPSLCSPPTGKTGQLQAVQIQLLLLSNERSHYHRQDSSAR